MNFIKKLVSNHLLMSGFYKGISGLSLFGSIPILVVLMGNSVYGLWILIYAFFQWVLLLDFGISSVLKTKLPLLIEQNKTDLISKYIKTTYFYSTIIALVIFICSFIFIYLFSFTNFLNITFFDEVFVKKIILLNILFFCINFIFNIHKSLFVAFLRGKFAEQSIAVYQFLFLLSLAFSIPFLKTKDATFIIVYVSVLNGFISVLTNIAYTWYLFHVEKIRFISKGFINQTFKNELLSLGFKFMIIQIGGLVLFSSDNYILSNAFKPSEIVLFDNVYNKLFQIPLMIFFAALSPLWSMFASQYAAMQKDIILKTFKKFNFLFLFLIVFVVILTLISPHILKFWLHIDINFNNSLIVLSAFAVILRLYVTFYTFFLSGVGKLNIYLGLLIVSIIFKFLLSYFFISLGLKINSVLWATIIVLVVWSISLPATSYAFIKKQKNE